MPESKPEPAEGTVALARMEWSEVREPGCYLHVASGLVARIYAEDLDSQGPPRDGGGGLVVRLDPNPGAPLTRLREIAAQHGLSLSS